MSDELKEYFRGDLNEYVTTLMYNFEFITRENEITKQFIKKTDTSSQTDETKRTDNLFIFQTTLKIILSNFLALKIGSNNKEKLIVEVRMNEDGQNLRIYLYKCIPKKSNALLRVEEEEAKAAKRAALWKFASLANPKD